MKLSDGTIYLRALEPSDLDTVYLLETESALTDSGFFSAPPSRMFLSRYLQEYDADVFAARQVRFGICLSSTGQLIGTADLSDLNFQSRNGFIGIGLLPAMRGRGLGARAVRLLCGYAREELHLHCLCVQVAADNEASRRLFEACGFSTCGCLRSWLRRGAKYYDALLLQILFPHS